MYKITLYDENNCSFISGTSEFFVDDINEFEEFWLNNQAVPNEQKSRYRMSKSGHIVSDYYVTNEYYNIFQHDLNAKILKEFDFNFTDEIFKLHNFYGCESILYTRAAKIRFRKIIFKEYFYWIGRYKLMGVCLDEYLVKGYWRECSNWGNKILKMVKHSDIRARDLNGRRRRDCGKDIFAEDSVETCCWITVASSKNEGDFLFEEDELLPNEIIDRLMRDVLGEAG